MKTRSPRFHVSRSPILPLLGAILLGSLSCFAEAPQEPMGRSPAHDSAVPASSAREMTVDFSEEGQPQISVAGRKLNPAMTPASPTVRFRDPGFQPHRTGSKTEDFPMLPEDQKIISSQWDRDSKTLQQNFVWGRVLWKWVVERHRLDLELRIENDSDRTLCAFSLDLLNFQLPEGSAPPMLGVRTFFGQPAPTDRMDTHTGPVVLPMTIGNQSLVAVSPETQNYLELAWIPAKTKSSVVQVPEHGDPEAVKLAAAAAGRSGWDGSGTPSEWKLSVSLGGGELIWHERFATRPIPPRQSDTLRVSLRLADAENPFAVAGDIFEAYRQAHPVIFQWDDRRPVLRSFLGDSFSVHQPVDPEGSKPQGVSCPPEFRQRLMAHADELIEAMTKVGAQGFIFWNVEGGNEPAIKYVGSPAMVEKLSPEMDAVADEFFEKIRKAGFRTGLCLRPSTVMPMEVNGKWVWRHRNPRDRDVVDVLSEKIAYAQKRWGCTLFYIDTNKVIRFPISDEEKASWPKDKTGTPLVSNELMNSDQWRELSRRHPDVLLIPEHCYLDYYGATARYSEIDFNGRKPAPLVRAMWPKALHVMFNGRSLPLTAYWETLVEAILADQITGLGMDSVSRDLSLLVEAKREAGYRRAGEPSLVAGASPEQWLEMVTNEKGDPTIQYFAVRRLVESEAPLSAESLRLFFGDSDFLVRKASIDAIKDPSQLEAFLWWFEKLSKDKESAKMEPLVTAAMDRLGAPAVDVVVEKIKANPNPQSAVQAVWFLGRSNLPQAHRACVNLLKDASLPEVVQVAGGRSLAFHPRMPLKSEVIEGLGAMMPTTKSPASVASALHRLDPKTAHALIQPRIDQEKAASTPDQKLISELEKFTAKK